MKYTLVLIYIAVSMTLSATTLSTKNIIKTTSSIANLRANEAYEAAFQLSKNFHKSHPEINTIIDPATVDFLMESARIHSRMAYADEAIQFAESALSIQKEIDATQILILGEIYYLLGEIYRRTYQNAKAESYYKDALSIRLENLEKDHALVADSYNALGINYSHLGEVNKSMGALHKALEIRLKIYGENHKETAIVYDNFGIIYDRNKEYDQALVHYTKSRDILLKLGTKPNAQLGDIYDHIGGTLIHLNKLDKALSNFKQSLAIRKAIYPEAHNEISDSYDNIGRIYRLRNEYAKALKYHQDGLDIKRLYYKGEHPDIAYSYLLIGKIFFDQKKYAESIPYYEKATKGFLEKMGKYSFYSIDTYMQWAKAYQANKQLDEALTCFKDIDRLIDEIRRQSNKKGSELGFLKKSFPVYEDAIMVALELYEQSKNPSYLEEAYLFSAKSRAALLYESLHGASIQQYSGILESTLEKEHQLQLELTDIDKQIYKEKDPNKLKKLKEKHYDLKQDWSKHTEIIKKEHPAYFNLKLNPEFISVAAIQEKLLNESQIVLEYFVGKTELYIFVITKNKFEVKRVPIDFPLNDWVTTLRTSLFAQGHNSIANNDDTSQLFMDRAFQLYEKLIRPAQSLIANKSELIIVADGILGYIPFEILVEKAVNKFTGFRSPAYLLKSHSISYTYSMNLLQLMQEKQTTAHKNILAFAPSFPASPQSLKLVNQVNYLPQLVYSLLEVEAIAALCGATVYKNKTANLANFKTQAPHYKILHLSTHGKADDRMGDYCFLAFTPTNDSLDNLLYARDLYNMELNADMVVLSACETGIGELQNGEGIISLGRGFAYAGAKSIISTQWSVNEISTKEIMESFYSKLKEGLPKDKALQAAKLAYLNNSTHPEPFYWAAFNATGDMIAINFQKSSFPWHRILILVGIILLFGVLFKRNIV